MTQAEQKLQQKMMRLAKIVERKEFGIADELNILEERVESLEMKPEIEPDKGDKGDKGDVGPRGVDGRDGVDGRNGIDGRDGIGKDGRDGRDGSDGKDGIDGIDGSPDTVQQVRDKLETLKGNDRLDISAIKGLGKRLLKLSDDIVNRAISILDQRTSFLINKVSNLQNQVNNLPTTAGLTLLTTASTVNGTNQVFIFTTAPSIIYADGVPMQKVASDGTVNWTGTTTITLSIAPTFDIYGL